MKHIDDVIHFILTARDASGMVVVATSDFERLRDEAREYCAENDEPFSSSPTFLTPHFLIYGIPVVAGGQA